MSGQGSGSGAKKPVDVNFINPFMEGAVMVMESICSTKASRESVFKREADSPRGDISAVVVVKSQTNSGSFGIAFEKGCFLAANNRMHETAHTEITDENKKVAGVICGQILEYARLKLAELGHDIQPAEPSVQVGQAQPIQHSAQGIVIATKFKTLDGWFMVEAAFAG